jgi:hypothetical protein
MLRIDVESGSATYAVPSSNPFVNNSGTRPEIWALGLRNPWKYTFDRETGDLWIADVGQNRAEEVNVQVASSRGGENYGWRRMEGLQCYPSGSGCDRSGLTLPVVEYVRSEGVSVTGVTFIAGHDIRRCAGSTCTRISGAGTSGLCNALATLGTTAEFLRAGGTFHRSARIRAASCTSRTIPVEAFS